MPVGKIVHALPEDFENEDELMDFVKCKIESLVAEHQHQLEENNEGVPIVYSGSCHTMSNELSVEQVLSGQDCGMTELLVFSREHNQRVSDALPLYCRRRRDEEFQRCRNQVPQAI